MGNIMVRMGVVIGTLVLVKLGFSYVGHMGRPEVVEPQRPITEFPQVLSTPSSGNWEGKDAPLDERSFNNSEVDKVVSRVYTREGRVIKFLLAEYNSPRAGVYHNPMNCYSTQGFTLLAPTASP